MYRVLFMNTPTLRHNESIVDVWVPGSSMSADCRIPHALYDGVASVLKCNLHIIESLLKCNPDTRGSNVNAIHSTTFTVCPGLTPPAPAGGLLHMPIWIEDARLVRQVYRTSPPNVTVGNVSSRPISLYCLAGRRRLVG